LGRHKKEAPNHGNLYEVKITTGHNMQGKPIRKSFYSPTSKDDAREQAKKWMVEKKVSERTGETFIEKEYTFSQWAKKWLEIYKKGKVKQHTYDYTYRVNVETYMIPFFGQAKLQDITQANIQEYFNKHSFLAENNLKRHRMILRNIFDKAVYNDLCRKNPVEGIVYQSVKEKSVRSAYTKEQMDKLIEYAKSHHGGVMIVIMLNTGVRRGELLGLKWIDIDYERKSIFVRRSVTPDTDEPQDGEVKSKSSYREIPVSDEFLEYLKTLPHKTDYVIPGKTKYGYMSIDGFEGRYRRFMEDACSALDIPYLVPHELRHTFGTVLREKGIDIYTISRVMGHGDVLVTDKIYVHNDYDVLRKNMGYGEKSGTGVVQVSYGRKFKVKRAKKKAAQTTE
jgi:integrase